MVPLLQQPEPVRKRRILIADDDLDFLNLVSRSLSSHGYEVITASTGLDAMQVIAYETVDVVIADERIPGEPRLAGAGLLELAAIMQPGARLVLISGWASSWHQERTERIGGIVVDKNEAWLARLLAVVR